MEETAILANWQPVFLLCAVILPVFAFELFKYWRYRSGAYYRITRNSYLAVVRDSGKYGEYLVYKRLRQLEKDGARFLFNLYIPRSHNHKTEIDVLLICAEGLFVIESKNLGGWIFGNEGQHNWVQVYPRGRGRSRKEWFYNPIRQNEGHIRYLKKVLGEVPTYSIIGFSDRCTLKNVTVRSSNVIVTYYSGLALAVNVAQHEKQGVLWTKAEVDAVYDRLIGFTQVSDQEMKQHVETLRAYKLEEKP